MRWKNKTKRPTRNQHLSCLKKRQNQHLCLCFLFLFPCLWLSDLNGLSLTALPLMMTFIWPRPWRLERKKKTGCIKLALTKRERSENLTRSIQEQENSVASAFCLLRKYNLRAAPGHRFSKDNKLYITFTSPSTRMVLLQPGDRIERKVPITATSPGTKLLMATFSHSGSQTAVSRSFHKVSVKTDWAGRRRTPQHFNPENMYIFFYIYGARWFVIYVMCIYLNCTYLMKNENYEQKHLHSLVIDIIRHVTLHNTMHKCRHQTLKRYFFL